MYIMGDYNTNFGVLTLGMRFHNVSVFLEDGGPPTSRDLKRLRKTVGFLESVAKADSYHIGGDVCTSEDRKAYDFLSRYLPIEDFSRIKINVDEHVDNLKGAMKPDYVPGSPEVKKTEELFAFLGQHYISLSEVFDKR
jgi:hypothetical protein